MEVTPAATPLLAATGFGVGLGKGVNVFAGAFAGASAGAFGGLFRGDFFGVQLGDTEGVGLLDVEIPFRVRRTMGEMGGGEVSRCEKGWGGGENW